MWVCDVWCGDWSPCRSEEAVVCRLYLPSYLSLKFNLCLQTFLQLSQKISKFSTLSTLSWIVMTTGNLLWIRWKFYKQMYCSLSKVRLLMNYKPLTGRWETFVFSQYIILRTPSQHYLLLILSNTRGLPHTLLLLHDRLRHPLVFPRGLRGPVHREGRDVRGGTAGPDIQGCGILCHHHGLSRECLLHHRRHLDTILPLQHLHGFPQSSLERLQ